MGSMAEEVKEKNDFSASFSWWSDSHNRSHQSHWLQAALSDLDEKTKTIVDVVQEGGDNNTFAKRAEMFYERRPQLIKMVNELHKSYIALAEKYDKLIRSETTKRLHLLHNRMMTRKIETESISEDQDQDQETFHPEVQTFNVDFLDLENELVPNFKPGTETNGVELNGKIEMDSREKAKLTRSEMSLKLSKLVEENMQQQSELIRRNEEKREVIKQLRLQINRLMEENRSLKNCIPTYKLEMKRSQSCVAKLKGLDCTRRFHG